MAEEMKNASTLHEASVGIIIIAEDEYDRIDWGTSMDVSVERPVSTVRFRLLDGGRRMPSLPDDLI